ncbi:hypothetical protein [Mesorhizobium sp.]|uniref:hypothetical protein n=1 Tax=Mesorhizobium sp. TaxID=1871066 RepID=UPI00258C0F05|nr:hypothetical protein [Mesorhizobium sp.]
MLRTRELLAWRHTTLCGAFAEEGTHGQRQIVLSQVSHHGPRTVKLAELGEDQAEPRLHLLIGIENDLARAAMRQSGGNGRRSSPRAAF